MTTLPKSSELSVDDAIKAVEEMRQRELSKPETEDTPQTAPSEEASGQTSEEATQVTEDPKAESIDSDLGDSDSFIEETKTEDKAEDTQDIEEVSSSDSEDEGWKKRYGDLRKVEQSLREEINTLKTAVDDANKPELNLKSADELEAFSKEYPNQYAILETLIHNKLSEADENVQKRLEDVQKVTEAVAKKEAQARLIETVSKAHPDALKVRNSEEFKAWFEKQSDSRKKLFGKDPQLVIDGLTLYKSETKNTKKEEQAKASQVVTTSKSSAEPKGEASKKYLYTESQIASMSQQEKHQRAEDIMTAYRDGKILLDLSS